MFRTTIPTALLAIGATALLAGPAAAKVPGSNGRIVFTDRDAAITYTVNPDGSDRRAILTDNEGVHWSSDGTHLAGVVAASDGRITTRLSSPDGSNPVIEALPHPTQNFPCVIWAPDDAHLACEVWDDIDATFVPGIFTMRADGWDMPTRLTTNPFGGHDIPTDYSPDGTRLTFMREDPARGKAVYVLELATGEVRRVGSWFADPFGAAWSPDGRTLLYDDSAGHILSNSPSGGHEKRLRIHLDGARAVFRPGWSPDGTRIIFNAFARSGPRAGHVGLYTANPDGRDARPVYIAPDGFPELEFDWGPAGTLRK